MFLTNNYICFYSKILSNENILIIRLTHVNSVTRAMHALIFPTAIRIVTKNSTYSFTSFRSRSNTLDHLTELLKHARQKQIEQMDKQEIADGLKTVDPEPVIVDELTQVDAGMIEESFLEETTSINRTDSESNLSNCVDVGCEDSQFLSNKKISISFIINPTRMAFTITIIIQIHRTK